MTVCSQSPSERTTDGLDLPVQLQSDNPLWQFALAFWRKAGVQDNCLALQQQGWSVTRVLCAAWLALDGQSYTGSEDATVTEWRNRVTGALRSVRQLLPKASAQCRTLREGVAGLELEAERIELALAWHTLTTNRLDTGDMHGRDVLIQNNLEAAAPSPDAVPNAKSQLNALAGTLAHISTGDHKP